MSTNSSFGCLESSKAWNEINLREKKRQPKITFRVKPLYYFNMLQNTFHETVANPFYRTSWGGEFELKLLNNQLCLLVCVCNHLIGSQRIILVHRSTQNTIAPLCAVVYDAFEVSSVCSDFCNRPLICFLVVLGFCFLYFKWFSFNFCWGSSSIFEERHFFMKGNNIKFNEICYIRLFDCFSHVKQCQRHSWSKGTLVLIKFCPIFEENNIKNS